MRRRAVVVLVTAGAGALAAGSLIGGGVAGTTPDPRVARVVEHVDGDTIAVRFLSGTVRTVRYIGVVAPSTPATGDPLACWGRRATLANRRLVPIGERVRLEFDVLRRHRTGALPAYVFRARDGRFVQADLVRGGHVRGLRTPPNVRHAELLTRLERGARAAGRGLWAACSSESP